MSLQRAVELAFVDSQLRAGVLQQSLTPWAPADLSHAEPTGKGRHNA